MTTRTINIHGQEIAIDREDFASAVAEALRGTLSPEARRELDNDFLGIENNLRNWFLHTIEDPNTKARYFWQLARDETPAGDLTVFLFEVGEDQTPRSIKINLKGFFPKVESFKTWMFRQYRAPEIDAVIKEFVLPQVNERTQKRLGKVHRFKLSPKSIPGGLPKEHHAQILNARSNAVRHMFTQDDLGKRLDFTLKEGSDRVFPAMAATERQELIRILGEGLSQRLAAKETSSLQAFKSALDTESVSILNGCQAFNLDTYRWLRSSDGNLYKKDEKVIQKTDQRFLYRRQFIQSMPLFAHLCFASFTPAQTRKQARSMRDLDYLIQGGDEILAIHKTDKDGKAVEEAGDGLKLFASALASTVFRKGVDSKESMEASLLTRPRTLRHLARLPLSKIGDIDLFALTMPHVLHLAPEHLPTSPQGWECARLISLTPPLNRERYLNEAKGRWGEVYCGLAARLAKAKSEGGIAAEQDLKTALFNTRDYADFIFNSLVLPALVKASAGSLQNLPSWLAAPLAIVRLRAHFLSHFNLNSLLEQSLQYHKTHVLQQYQAVVFEQEIGKHAGLNWLPLTEDFTIPHGTRHNGVDIGGTRLTWLTSKEALWQEGAENKNCVAGYTSSCLGNYHILRMEAPERESTKGYLRTTVSIFEERGPNQEILIHPGQNKKYRDVEVGLGTPSYAAQHWLIDKINEGQKARAALGTKAQSQVPARIDARTGLPDFSTIDFTKVQERRNQLIPLNVGHSFPYDPGAPEIFEKVLASANQHRLLPRALRGAASAEELVAKMGIKIEGDKLNFSWILDESGPRRPGTPPTAPAPGMGL